MNSSKKMATFQMAAVGLMGALVFLSSQMQIPIPIGDQQTRIHLGNVFCILSGLLLGPVKGGLSAGIGSFFFDLTNPLYIASAPFTFAFKFFMAFVAGKITYLGGKVTPVKTAVGAVSGSLSYVVLYLSKGFIENALLGMPAAANWAVIIPKGGISALNGIIACAVAIPLFYALKGALSKNNLFTRMNGQPTSS